MKKKVENKELLILTPFELPDVRLAVETLKAGAFPILHLGRDKKKAKESLGELSQKTQRPFGVCFTADELNNIQLPEQVSKVVLPFGKKISVSKSVEILYQIHSLKEAHTAIKEKVSAIVIKGNEGAGNVANESSFVLFQGIMDASRKAGVKVYIQGGAGIHTSTAFLALGAQGVIFDSQTATFPECSAPKELKNLCAKLNGSEIIAIDNFKVLSRKNSPALPENPHFKDLRPFLNGYDISTGYLPVGQDVALSSDLYRQYKKLRDFVFAFYEALHGHILQAKKINITSPHSPLAKELDIKYPIAQGPMARISDVPEFVKEVADAGALPFLALSVMKGQALRDAVTKTAELLGDQTWGISLFGFSTPEVYKEQSRLILETKPKIVLFSGGHGILAKQFANAGIKTFVHAPSSVLLEQYIKEGITNLVFEGRESGGHVGPFWSTILWEKQINRLLQEDDLSGFNIFFAGGIHNAFSSAFISIMAAGLAVRGAKIGLQMGTSYLFTKEIVKTGAIAPLYQKLSVENTQTACIESVPGQVSRIIPSPFADYFMKEKQRILAGGTDSHNTRLLLEGLIAGRLRLASKGIERQGDNLVKQTLEEQYEKGMFMIGDISILTGKLSTLEKLHTAVAVDSQKILSELKEFPMPASLSNPANIAVIGMECILPEASNIDEYWKNIVVGKDCIVEVPDIRWNKSIFYKPGTMDTDYISCNTGGFVPTVDFDPMEFGITPQSLASIEPLQLLSLLVAKRALENAGYSEMAADESENTSVIFGGEGLTDLAARTGFRSSYRQFVGELPEELKKRLPVLTTDTFAGLLSNVTPGRISNRLNLRGRNYTVNSACASGLTALEIACKELITYDSDMVILGGDDFHSMLNDYILFSSTHALSSNGYCASFDAKADGMTMGEGVGVLILKRLEDAERAGDKIYAVIRGVGGSSDGKGLGLTAPNKEGQMLAMQRAYRMAGISPSEVGLIEAHGTGTGVGDRVEFRSTSSVLWNGGATAGQAYLGTVKSQIGHTKCAAGISGLLRAVLSVYHGVIPPTIHLSKPLNLYDSKTSPFVFATQTGIWNSEKRIAGINAFGFGGTNGHAIVENYSPEVSNRSTLKLWPSELFVFRGDNLEEAKQKVVKLKEVLSINNSLPLKDVAYSFAIESDKPVQIVVVASLLDDLFNRMLEFNLQGKSASVYHRNEKQGKVAFLFSGQGSQRVNMARDLLVAFPAMRRLLIQNREYEKILFPHTLFGEAEKREWNKTITDTQNAQPVLGIIDYAIAEYLRFLEIEPDMVAGHSYGELPALCFAGAFDSEKLVEISRERANSILKAIQDDAGKMVAVSIPEDDLNTLLKDETEIWAVNFNSPTQTVLAGTTPGMAAFTEKLAGKNIAYLEINVACAFHSPLLAKAKEFYTNVLEDIPFDKLQMPVWSNTTAGLYPKNGNEIKERLAEHLVQPVLFSREIEQMYADGARIFIETGPGNALTGLTQSILEKGITTIQTEAKGKEGITFLLHALAQYLATGKTFNIAKLFEGRDVKVIDFDHPEKYRKSKLIWRVNGQYAYPAEGKLSNIGGMPFAEPLGLKLVSEAELASMSKNNFAPDVRLPSDQVMMEYLGSIRSLIQNQRDVMLSYFGQNPQEIHLRPVEPSMPRAIETKVQTVEASQPTVAGTLSVVPAAGKNNLTVEQIKKMLLDVVSDKTGYPVEMLGMDLDLEGDLSIDSIKRMEIVGELKEKLNLSDEISRSEETFVKMASLKTLNELISWMEEVGVATIAANASTDAQPVVSEALVPAASEINQNSTQSFDIEYIKNTLLEVVSDKTGYPIEMLGMDLDLEGDLSIDSIKRMEIIGDLKEKLNLSDEIENSEETFVKMSSLKTLNELIAWIDELNMPDSMTVSKPEQEAGETTGEQKTPQQPVELIRILLDMHPYLLKPEKISIEGKRFAVTDDGGEYLAAQIKSLLENAGAQVDIIQPDADIASCDGLILVNAAASPNSYTLRDLFTLIHGTKLNHLKWVFTFSDIIGKIENGKNLDDIKQIQGFSGLFKSLRLEYPEVKFRSVLSHTLFDIKALPQIVLDELTVDDVYPEVLYKGSERFSYKIRIEPLIFDEANVGSNLKLGKDSVVLVLGGAQGIAPELTAQLAAEYPCRYLLVGRSKQLDDPEGVYAKLKTLLDIRKHLITVEGMKVPAEIEKKIQKIFKSNQIAEAVAKIEKTGAQVAYRSIDIRDQDHFKTFLQSVREEYGKIDGIIHSAGLIHDKYFADKTWESFEQVYQAKVNPLHVIMKEMNDDLKLLVLFSSIASLYGNKGQTDYTAANSVFDLVASLNNLKPDLRIVTFNWNAWKGAGMVSESLEAEFARRGISLIPLKEGGAYFVNELKYGKDARIILTGGGEEVENVLKKWD
jgi:acyl transferase domain-containing protein/NAD(P)H-dependent flavin oxidoreductase YrpB (nitropropane dioxygenase family)/NAD(P)-dependent dehydrogenase (short-subunit alcohol dehydrogenase family)/acyl carrier protein